jgi:prepilin-type processing-associated H-X9-DG protein
VISIIALLLAILLPSLARAREQGKAVVCLNNLRQMIIAANTYSQNYSDYYPTAHYQLQTPTGTSDCCWDFSVVSDLAGNIKIIPGLLWQGETIMKIQQCSAFKGNSNADLDPYTGYNYNTSYIGHGEGERIAVPAKVTAVKHPAGCALFGDGQWSEGANKFMRSPKGAKFAPDSTFASRAAGAQGFRHLGKTNVAWADGHASPMVSVYTDVYPDMGGRQKQSLEEYNRENPKQKIGFLSPDNSAYDLE